MKLPYKISENAIDDLNHIWLYTFKKWSLHQADRYYNLIIEEINFIARNFDKGKNQNHIREGYYSSKVKSHIIFYKKQTDGKIEIIRILHERMDMEDRLK